MILEIYNQEKWNRLPKDFIITIVLGAFLVIAYYVDKNFNIYVHNLYYDIPLQILSWSFGISFAYMMLNPIIFKERNLKEFVGKIELKKDEVIISQTKIQLNNIENINIEFNKAEGEYGILTRLPYRSNGTDNRIMIYLKDGKRYCYFVKIKHKGIFRKNNKILIHYHNLGIFNWSNLLELFEIYDNEFKEKLRNAIKNEKKR